MTDFLVAQTLWPANGRFDHLVAPEDQGGLFLEPLYAHGLQLLWDLETPSEHVWNYWVRVLETPRLESRGARQRILRAIVMEHRDWPEVWRELGFPEEARSLAALQRARRGVKRCEPEEVLRSVLEARLGRALYERATPRRDRSKYIDATTAPLALELFESVLNKARAVTSRLEGGATSRVTSSEARPCDTGGDAKT